MIFDVTAEHIERASPGDGWLCPVALAIKDRLGHGIFVHVNGIAQIEISERPGDGDTPEITHAMSVRGSRSVRKFVDDYDARRTVAPFRFRLDLQQAAAWLPDAGSSKASPASRQGGARAR